MPRRPFLVTMNGQNRYELAGDFMEEYAALDNRSVVLLMNEPLSYLFPEYVIECIVKSPFIFVSARKDD